MAQNGIKSNTKPYGIASRKYRKNKLKNITKYFKIDSMFSISLLAVLLICAGFSQLAKARSISLALNLTLGHDDLVELLRDPSTTTAAPIDKKLSFDMLSSCIRETEISVSQLKLFRLSLLTNHEDDEYPSVDAAQLAALDYGSLQTAYLDLKHNEPFQCFIRCLYDRLGLIRYELLMEEAFRTQVQTILQHEHPEMKECMNLESKNRCEAAFKLNLCYNYLRSFEAEKRVREMLDKAEMADANQTEEKGVDENGDIDDTNGGGNDNNFESTVVKDSSENKV